MKGKKIICLLLAVLIALVCLSLGACGNKPDDKEILAEFRELYRKSIAVNDYVFGAGLPCAEDFDNENVTSPYYVTVSESAEYRTAGDLKNAVLEVYSQDYYDDALDSLLFSGYGDGGRLKARYVEEKGVLKVDVANKGADTGGRFDTESAQVVKSSASSASIRATYVRGEKVSSYTLTMVKTPSGWRFDAPTY